MIQTRFVRFVSAHVETLLVPTPPSSLQEIDVDSSSDHKNDTESDEYCRSDDYSAPKIQHKHNDPTLYLNVCKEAAELLGEDS